MRKNKKQNDQKHRDEGGNGLYAALKGEEARSKNMPDFFQHKHTQTETPTETHSEEPPSFYAALQHSL